MRGWLVVAAMYLATAVGFVTFAADDGLLTPGGTVSPVVGALAVATIVLRGLVLFVALPIVAYRLTTTLLIPR